MGCWNTPIAGGGRQRPAFDGSHNEFRRSGGRQVRGLRVTDRLPGPYRGGRLAGEHPARESLGKRSPKCHRRAKGALWRFPAVSVLVFWIACSGQQEPFRGNGPPEAFLDGSEYPYFGAETAWDLRFFTEHPERMAKRRGQRQMLDLVRGRPAQAARYAEELLAADPTDQESLFNLAIARAQLGELELALEAARLAEEAGLPFERFLAGPRDLLKPLTESEPFRKEASRRDIRLIHGPMVGSVTDTGARFWVRTADQAAVQVVAAVDDGDTGFFSPEIRSETARSTAATDYTAIAALDGMEPRTRYRYDVLVDGRSELGPSYPSFATSPERGGPSRFSVGFGGGAGYVVQNERMWDVIKSRDPQAFLFLGDNVYIDLPERPAGMHYYTYYRRQSRKEFRRLVASTAVYAIWDDHDCATDDVWMGPYRDMPAWKMPSLRHFRQNWVNPGYGSEEWPATWFEFAIGDVDFFMLDGRFYRTNPFGESPTMLGPAQKQWLLERVKQSTATFKVLVSPVPWSFNTKGDAVDTWNGFRRERGEVFDFLAENRIEGVFLLSADRHRSDARRIERRSGYPLYEFESSRLTNQAMHDLVPGALFAYNEKQSFGLLLFDTTKDDPTVTFRIISIDDEVKGEISLQRSELAHSEL